MLGHTSTYWNISDAGPTTHHPQNTQCDLVTANRGGGYAMDALFLLDDKNAAR